jgi:hypothetical protein
MEISRIAKPLTEEQCLPFTPTEEQKGQLAFLMSEIPGVGTKLVSSAAILEAVAEHQMTMTTAAVFHHLCSSYGTRSDGTLTGTRSDHAAMIGLKLDAYVKAYRKLIGYGLVTPQGVVAHGINKNDWKKMAANENEAMTKKDQRRGKVKPETLMMKFIGETTGWKRVYRNGIQTKLSGAGQWAIYWQVYHLAGAHGHVGEQDLKNLAEEWYLRDKKHLTRTSIPDLIDRLVGVGAFRRTGNRLQALNAVQESQIAYVTKTTGFCNSGGTSPYTDGSHTTHQSIKALHETRDRLTKSIGFVRLQTMLPGHENFGLLYNGVRETGEVERAIPRGEKCMLPVEEHTYLSPADVDKYIREMAELTDKAPRRWSRRGWPPPMPEKTSKLPELYQLASDLYRTKVNELYPVQMLAYALLCRFAGVPVHVSVAGILEQCSKAEAGGARCSSLDSDVISHDALGYAIRKYGLIDHVTDDASLPDGLRSMMVTVLNMWPEKTNELIKAHFDRMAAESSQRSQLSNPRPKFPLA